MLAELNEAYSILSNAASRKEYDDVRARQQQRTSNTPQPPRSEPAPPLFEFEDLTSGQVVFGNLPENVQFRLLERQQNKGGEQVQVELSSAVWNYIFILILLCWYWFLFATADGPKWQINALLWCAVGSLVVGLLIGRNLATIWKWSKAKLKSYFYVTPLYFIKTEFDIVSFRPIWTLKDLAVTHNYRNGSYKSSDIVLEFDGHDESLALSSKDKVESFLSQLRAYDNRLRAAYADQDHNYLLKHDDFHGVPRSCVPTQGLLSRRIQMSIYVVSVSVCLIGFVAAVVTNEKHSNSRWVKHSTPPPTPCIASPIPNNVPNPTRESVAAPSYPKQPLPHSGSVRRWIFQEPIAPFEIKAAQESHSVVKLVDAYTNKPVMMVFVRGGTTVEVKVPLGKYEVRYASGDTWYGYEYLFGPDTLYSKAANTFTFDVVGNKISGFTITLYKVVDGNLHTSRINASDF